MIKKCIPLLLILLQACSSQPSRDDLNNNKVLDTKILPDCSAGLVLKQSEIDVFKGRTPQNTKGWNQIARCYYNRGEIGVAELFYEKTVKSDSKNFMALNGLLKIAMRKQNYSQASNYAKQLQQSFGNKIEVWEQSSRLALNFYDLPMASKSISRLARFSDKKLYNLYSTYQLALLDKKSQALIKWKKLNHESFKTWPEAAFTAAYLGYLLDDKIKARKFLNTAGEDSNPEMFDKLSRLVE